MNNDNALVLLEKILEELETNNKLLRILVATHGTASGQLVQLEEGHIFSQSIEKINELTNKLISDLDHPENGQD